MLASKGGHSGLKGSSAEPRTIDRSGSLNSSYQGRSSIPIPSTSLISYLLLASHPAQVVGKASAALPLSVEQRRAACQRAFLGRMSQKSASKRTSAAQIHMRAFAKIGDPQYRCPLLGFRWNKDPDEVPRISEADALIISGGQEAVASLLSRKTSKTLKNHGPL